MSSTLCGRCVCLSNVFLSRFVVYISRSEWRASPTLCDCLSDVFHALWSMHLSDVCLSRFVSLCLPEWCLTLMICLSACLSDVCLSHFVSVCLSVWCLSLAVSLSISLFVRLSSSSFLSFQLPSHPLSPFLCLAKFHFHSLFLSFYDFFFLFFCLSLSILFHRHVKKLRLWL